MVFHVRGDPALRPSRLPYLSSHAQGPLFVPPLGLCICFLGIIGEYVQLLGKNS